MAEILRARDIPTKMLDGDVARRTFSKNLTFSKEDRAENCRRAAHVGSYLAENNIVLASFIAPYNSIRKYFAAANDEFLLVYVKCPFKICERRDTKGMYAQLVNGKLKGTPFTGAHWLAPYEIPYKRDLVLETHNETVEESARKVVGLLELEGYI